MSYPQSRGPLKVPYSVDNSATNGHRRYLLFSDFMLYILTMEQQLTPMLKQYQEIKSKHQNCILFYRLGDFYEMFYEDARQASSLLGLVLTSRGTLNSAKVPMCGIPYHAADTYIAKLIKAGLKVGICEQVEDPALAKGIVKREVIRIITAGTFIDDSGYTVRCLLCININNKKIGIAFTDTASGTIQTNEYSDQNKALEIIESHLDKEVLSLIKQVLLKETAQIIRNKAKAIIDEAGKNRTESAVF